MKTFLADKDYPYFTLYTKAETPIKILIRHLPNNNSSEDITVALQELGYEVIRFLKLVSTICRRKWDRSAIGKDSIFNTSCDFWNAATSFRTLSANKHTDSYAPPY
jgi:hypothetical protein